MKSRTLQATGLVVALFGATYVVQAQSASSGRGTRAEMMEKYDADKNGKLDDAERAKMRKEMQAQRTNKGEPSKGPDIDQIMKKYDKDGNGELSKAEFEQFLKDLRNRQRPGGERNSWSERAEGGERSERAERGERGERGGRGTREEMVKKYDTDGDGKISEAERKVIREEMMKKIDTNGDGEISDAERNAAREEMMKRRNQE